MVGSEPSFKRPLEVARGRGTSLNPGNRFECIRLEVLPEAAADARAEHPCGVQVATRVYRERTRQIINRVDSPDLPFRWTINPYRGCSVGCCYCFSRPTHETLGFSCGLDFETKIVAKPDAPHLLRRELAAPGWHGEPIVMSGVTDCYQPLEAKLRITRACLEVMAECRQPTSIVTKNRLVVRDLDLLKSLAAHRAVSVTLSVTTLDQKLAALMEPRASRPADRLRAVSELADAGIPVSVLVAPIIPGLNDHEIPHLLRAAAEAGAGAARWVMLRLPHQVKTIFLDWLAVNFPDRAAKVEGYLRAMHAGRLYDPAWGSRMRGQGALAAQIADTFRVFAARHGLDGSMPTPSSAAFRPPRTHDDGQLSLFGEADAA